MCIKSDFKEIVFQPATNGQSDKTFLLTGAIYMYKITEKMCIESDLKETFFQTFITNDRNDKMLTSKFCPLGGGLSGLAPGLYTFMKS